MAWIVLNVGLYIEPDLTLTRHTSSAIVTTAPCPRLLPLLLPYRLHNQISPEHYVTMEIEWADVHCTSCTAPTYIHAYRLHECARTMVIGVVPSSLWFIRPTVSLNSFIAISSGRLHSSSSPRS